MPKIDRQRVRTDETQTSGQSRNIGHRHRHRDSHWNLEELLDHANKDMNVIPHQCLRAR